MLSSSLAHRLIAKVPPTCLPYWMPLYGMATLPAAQQRILLLALWQYLLAVTETLTSWPERTRLAPTYTVMPLLQK